MKNSSKILVAIISPVLVALLVLLIMQPRDGWLASNACSESTVSQLKSPSSAKIVSSSAYGPVSWNGSEMLGFPNAELEKLAYKISDFSEFVTAIDSIGFLLGPVRESDARGFFLVIGAVDGTNGFGATVRTNWICVVQVDGTNVRTQPTVIPFTN